MKWKRSNRMEMEVPQRQTVGPLSVPLAVLVAQGLLDEQVAQRVVERLGSKKVPGTFAEIVAEIRAVLRASGG